MAAGAAVAIAPHLYWYISDAGGADYAFVRDSVMTDDLVAAALGKSVYYLLGVIGYAAGPLLLFAAMRPGRAALADIAWPADDARRQALILFAVPMVLPALVNLVVPARLTPDWTFPNWALLPVVLYGSRKIAIDLLAAAGAALVALAVGVCFVLASPFMAYAHLTAGLDSNRPSSQEVAALAQKITDKPPRLYWGSPGITGKFCHFIWPARIGSRTIRCPTSAALRLQDRALSSPVSTTIRRAWPPKPRLPAPAPAPPLARSPAVFWAIPAKPIGFRVTVVPAPR